MASKTDQKEENELEKPEYKGQPAKQLVTI